ncbi:MAG: hypothetical protein ACRDY2_12825 [Acidimicrobiales bacterium]
MSGPNPRRVAWAAVYDDPVQVFVATDEYVLTRLLALNVVARSSPTGLDDRSLGHIRDALIEQRWGDAVALWVSATNTRLDAYPDEELWTAETVDEESVSLQVRLCPIFENPVL